MRSVGISRTRALTRVLNYEDARAAARRALPRAVYEYVDGGAEDEVTLRRNVAGFRELAFRPRMGIWGRQPDVETTLFGDRVSMPVLTAPCGGMRLVHPDGDLAVARAAAARGTIAVASAMSGYPLEELAEVEGPQWFQLYNFGGRDGTERLVARAQAAGYRALVVTVDSAVVGRREKDVRNGYDHSMRVSVRNAIRLAPQMVVRPRWVGRYVRDGMPFGIANTAALSSDGKPLPLSAMANAEESSCPTLQDIPWIRAAWTGPLLIKGVLTGEDARWAVAAGCDGVVISNHGGRQLEGAQATIDVLPEIAAAVGTEATVLLDSGIRRGADVVKALALGARAVLVGRPCVWGLAISGQTGVEHMLGLLRDEMARTMQLMGSQTIAELDPSWISTMQPARSMLSYPRFASTDDQEEIRV